MKALKIAPLTPLIIGLAVIMLLLISNIPESLSHMVGNTKPPGTGSWGRVARLHTPGIISVAASNEPLADFEGYPTYGAAPLTVDFNDISTGEVTAWAWDFGDKSTSQEQYPQHIYTVPNTYTVSLTVTGPGGSNTMVKKGYITVTEAGSNVFADFTADPIEGEAPLTVQFRSE